MNPCEYYQELLLRQMDEALLPREQAELEQHLASCEACRSFSQLLLGTEALLQEEEELPDALHESIMAEVRRDAIRAKNKKLRRFAGIAACLALVLLGTVGASGRLLRPKTTVYSMAASTSETCAAPAAMAEEAPAEYAADSVGVSAAAGALPEVRMENGSPSLLLSGEELELLLERFGSSSPDLALPEGEPSETLLLFCSEDDRSAELNRFDDILYCSFGEDCFCLEYAGSINDFLEELGL